MYLKARGYKNQARKALNELKNSPQRYFLPLHHGIHPLL